MGHSLSLHTDTHIGSNCPNASVPMAMAINTPNLTYYNSSVITSPDLGRFLWCPNTVGLYAVQVWFNMSCVCDGVCVMDLEQVDVALMGIPVSRPDENITRREK